MTVSQTHKCAAILCLTLTALSACAPVLPAQGDRAGTTGPRPVRTTPAVRTLRKMGYSVKIADIRERMATANTPQKKTDLKIELALVMGKAALSQNEPAMLVESELLYKEVIASSQGETRLKASNNLCALLLRSKRPHEAVAVMKDAERAFILGSWDMTIKMGDREFNPRLVVTTDEQKKLRVKWQSGWDEHEISDVQFTDGKLTFSCVGASSDNEWPYAYEGTLEGHALTGTLRTGRGEIKANGKLASQPIDRKMESRLLYNYGKALQMAGDRRGAYKALQDSMKADPRFRDAARAAAQIALDSSSESMGIPQMLELTDKQLALFDYEGAGRNLGDALVVDHWIGHEFYPRLLVQLLRYFTAADIDDKTFEAKWGPLLRRIEKDSRRDTDEREMARQILTISTGQLKLALDPGRVGNTFRWWTRSQNAADNKTALEALSDFMKATGDRFQDRDALDITLACYSNAWALNVENMEAGLYLANLLLYDYQKGKRALDPNGRILQLFIDMLFDAKNRQYRRGVGGDWERILKCHIILATIFEKQGRLTPGSNPATAAFQWEFAGRALPNVSAETRERFRPVVDAGIDRVENPTRRDP